MSVILETQRAVYAKLTGNAPLMAKVKGVYDHVPDSAEYPYVTIGDFLANDDSVKGTKAYKMELNISIYSRGKGRKEALDIVQLTYSLLHNQNLAIAGFNNYHIKVVSQGVTAQRASNSYEGKIFVRVNVNESI